MTLSQCWRLCRNFRVLWQLWYWYVQAWMHTTETSHQLSAQFYQWKFYSTTEIDKDLRSKFREDMVVGPSTVFTRKTVVDETHVRSSTMKGNAIRGLDASQFALTQCVNQCLLDCTKVISLSKLCEDSDPITTDLDASKMSYFQRMKLDCKYKSFHTKGTHKKLIVSLKMGFGEIALQCLKQWFVSIGTVHVKK